MDCPFCKAEGTGKMIETRLGNSKVDMRRIAVLAVREVGEMLKAAEIGDAPFRVRVHLCRSCQERWVTVEMEMSVLRDLCPMDG